MYGEGDKYYRRLAIEQASAAMALGEVPIGAVIVKDGEVIAAAHNMWESSGDPTAHAELTALQAAAERIGKRALCECELYVTVEPCAMCAGAIINARLKKAVFGAHEERTGCLGSVIDISEGYFINSVRAYGGVRDCRPQPELRVSAGMRSGGGAATREKTKVASEHLKESYRSRVIVFLFSRICRLARRMPPSPSAGSTP